MTLLIGNLAPAKGMQPFRSLQGALDFFPGWFVHVSGITKPMHQRTQHLGLKAKLLELRQPIAAKVKKLTQSMNPGKRNIICGQECFEGFLAGLLAVVGRDIEEAVLFTNQ